MRRRGGCAKAHGECVCVCVCVRGLREAAGGSWTLQQHGRPDRTGRYASYRLKMKGDWGGGVGGAGRRGIVIPPSFGLLKQTAPSDQWWT